MYMKVPIPLAAFGSNSGGKLQLPGQTGKYLQIPVRASRPCAKWQFPGAVLNTSYTLQDLKGFFQGTILRAFQ